MPKLIDTFRKQEKTTIIVAACTLVGVIAFVDYITGSEISLSILYVVPIGIVTWQLGMTAGLCISVASAFAWLLALNAFKLPVFHPSIQYWNACVRLGFFSIVTILLTALKEAQRRKAELENQYRTELEQRIQERTSELESVNKKLELEIVERVSAEKALLSSEKWFRALIEQSSDGILMLNSEGTVLYGSTSLHGITGYSSDELIGNSISILNPPGESGKADPFRRTIKESSPAPIHFTRPMLHKDRTIRWIEGVSQNLLSNEHVHAIVINFRDITERRRTEEKLLLLARAVESTSELICITDLDNRFIFVNKPYLDTYGYTESEILGKTPDILQPVGADLSTCKTVAKRTLEGGWKGELINRRKDGSEFPITLSTSLIKDPSGEPIGFIGVARDISDRKRAERAIQEAEIRFTQVFLDSMSGSEHSTDNAARDGAPPNLLLSDLAERINAVTDRMRDTLHHLLTFSTLASHELRTPLTLLRNQLEGALGINTSVDTVRNSLASAYDEVLYLERIVNDLLTIGRFQAGQIKLDLEPIRLPLFLDEMIEEFRTLLQGRDIVILSTPGPDLSIKGDVDRVRQVFFNLFENSLKHMPDHGNISISYRPAGKHVSLQFSDTGSGIHPEELSKIFDPYYKGRRGEGHETPGVGLGLTLVKSIIDAHHGTIVVKSAVGEGTTFTMTLPVDNDHIPVI